jgi:predicted RNA-binding protein with PIN domain
MDKMFKIKKVHLDSFINILVELYNRGVDYIDISSVNKTINQDGVGISFSKEYMNDEMMENFDKIQADMDEAMEEEEEEKPATKKDLTDEDLNQLL